MTNDGMSNDEWQKDLGRKDSRTIRPLPFIRHSSFGHSSLIRHSSFLLLLLLSAWVHAAERGRTPAVMVAKGPKIEGSLSDPLWQKAPPLRLLPVPGQDGKLSTTVRLLFDAVNLYAAIECEEPDRELQAKTRTRDSDVWADDCVELYVLPHPKVGYKQIAINPLGTIFDQSFSPGRGGDRRWNADLKVAVSMQPGEGWKVALSIPYKDLGAYAGNDQTWRFNATRFRKARGGDPAQEYSWSALPSAEFQQPEAFGAIEHIAIPGKSDGAAPRVDEIRSGLQWTRLPEPRGVRRLFPHPLDPDAVWCATSNGLLVTHDDGNTWAPVEGVKRETSNVKPEKTTPASSPFTSHDSRFTGLGEVTCLAVSPRDPATLCLGTDRRGLFLSSDGGATWKPLGSDAERYASNHIEWLDFCPSDPTRRTLLVTHGVAAPGISVSRDLGATWEVLGQDRFLGRFVKQAETIVAIGSMTDTEGKGFPAGIHRSGTDGLRWEEARRNIRPAAPAAPGAPWQFLVATLDGSILQSLDDGKNWEQVARSEGSTWTNLFPTSGPTAQTRILAAYDPLRQGLCLSRHRFSNGLGERENQGLYVGPYVKSGAACVANANGSTYYVAMNNALWVGRWARPAEGPAIVQARCLPCSVPLDTAAALQAQGELHTHIAAIASDGPAPSHVPSVAAAARAIRQSRAEMKFTVQAQVDHPRGIREIKTVTVDASELGAGASTLLHDDGAYNDEKAGDGIFGAAIQLSPAVLQQENFRETRLLTVKATDGAGASASWPAAVYIPRGLTAVSLMRASYDCDYAEGPVKVQMVHGEGLRPGTSVLRFAAAGPGPWRAAWVIPGDGVNGAGFQWLTFHIKGDTNQELFVHLMDHHKIGNEGFFDEPHYSQPAPLLAGGYLKAVTPTYQKVRVPIAKLLPKGVFFLRWHTAGLGLSAPNGARPGTYHVDLVQIEP